MQVSGPGTPWIDQIKQQQVRAGVGQLLDQGARIGGLVDVLDSQPAGYQQGQGFAESRVWVGDQDSISCLPRPQFTPVKIKMRLP